MNNKLKSSLLVFIFMVINMTSTSEILATKMTCIWDDDWVNDYDGLAPSNIIHDRFYSGMYSIHSNDREDRLYKFKRCKPLRLWTLHSSSLPITAYDEFWSRSCGGNSAITGISHWHSNSREDRQFKIYCGDLSSSKTKSAIDYTLDNCAWTSSYTNYDAIINYECPDDKVLRGLKSYHSNSKEDRKFIFECCQVMAAVTYNFQDISGEWDLVGANINGEHEYTLTTGTESGITNSITDEYSESLSVTVGVGFEYAVEYASVSGNVEVTGEISKLMSSIMEESFTYYAEESVTKSCDRDFYYQWVVSGTEIRSDGIYDTFDVYSKITLCTNVPQPQCPPFMAIDCDYQICTNEITSISCED